MTFEETRTAFKKAVHSMKPADRATHLRGLVAGLCVGCGYGRKACHCLGSEGRSPYPMPGDEPPDRGLVDGTAREFLRVWSTDPDTHPAMHDALFGLVDQAFKAGEAEADKIYGELLGKIAARLGYTTGEMLSKLE